MWLNKQTLCKNVLLSIVQAEGFYYSEDVLFIVDTVLHMLAIY